MASSIWVGVLGICAGVASIWTSGLYFLLLCTLGAYIYYLKTLQQDQSLQTQLLEKALQRELRDATESKNELEQALKGMLESCSDYFCVYQNDRIHLHSRSFTSLTNSIPSFWQDSLHDSCFPDFVENVNTVLNGEVSVCMKVYFRSLEPRQTQTIPSLSPILDALVDERRDDPMDLDMRKIVWKDKPAVLIRMKLHSRNAPVLDFIKTINHEFRTPLNIIIGLSDIIIGETQGHALAQRQKLVRQCACTLLATINSIIHQCELEWKLPTGLQHVRFNPKEMVIAAVESLQERLSRHGNELMYRLDESLPDALWGNMSHFRHVIAYLIQTCAEIIEKQSISMIIKAKCTDTRCDIEGELLTSCPAMCSRAEFQSVLQLFSLPLEADELQDTGYWSERIQAADQQAMFHLSIAREMCRLLLGDLQVKDTETHTLKLKFTLALSTREFFILKRKGNIFSDDEEFVAVKTRSYAEQFTLDEILTDINQESGRSESEESIVSGEGRMIKFRSQQVLYRRQPLLSAVQARRRNQTVPSSNMLFKQLPSNRGDVDESCDSPSSVQAEPLALIAEDIQYNAMVLSEMLKRLNISSVIVTNGVEALNFMQKYIPDVIFMDCQMPVMDGLEATRKIRDMKITVPIIAVTANGPERERECMEAGMDFFMSKPVRFAGLTSLVQKLELIK